MASFTQQRRDLARLVESEELGEAFFQAAARTARTDTERRQWEALYHLEEQTNRGVARFLAETGYDEVKPTNTLASVAGSAGGTGTLLLPRALQLRSLKAGTHRYLPAFRRLADAYRDTDHRAFFDYVVAHELAIIEFTDRARRDEHSELDAVHRLLDAGVPG